MDFRLTEEQEMIRDMVREFAEEELKPKAAHYDETAEFPFEMLKKLAKLGLMGMNIPEEYGGSNVGTLAYSLAITEIAKACAATAVTTSVTNLAAEVIYEFGTEEVKRKHLPKICSGEYPAASFALTEPQAGSDATNLIATAVRTSDHYIINGQKTLITSGEHAGAIVVWAVTDNEAKRGKGISAFVVEKGTPGFTIGKNEEKIRLNIINSKNQEGIQVLGLIKLIFLGRS